MPFQRTVNAWETFWADYVHINDIGNQGTLALGWWRAGIDARTRLIGVNQGGPLPGDVDGYVPAPEGYQNEELIDAHEYLNDRGPLR